MEVVCPECADRAGADVAFDHGVARPTLLDVPARQDDGCCKPPRVTVEFIDVVWSVKAM
jgi:hypothetical protein